MKVLVVFAALCICLSWAFALNDAQICYSNKCKIENNCRCPSTSNPYTGTEITPQLVAITISESIVSSLYDTYWEPLLFNRRNPDGKPIGASFYINHEYTNYELVQKLYLQGFEVAVHSITKNSSQEYWRRASKEDLIDEFKGQREIISTFANIPIEDIVGARTPQLQLEGDVSIHAYQESGIIYDNSWPTLSNNRLFPYTLDYASTQGCTVMMTCPKQSHPGFWIAPLTNIRGHNNVECNSLATCGIEGSADEIAQWLLDQLNKFRKSNRAPLVLRLDSYWFQFTENSFKGFSIFLDQLASLSDVFLVSVDDIIDWTKDPVALKNYSTPIKDREADCDPVTCELRNTQGNTRYMRSCIPCPEVYPWKGNPTGEVDDDSTANE